MIILFVCLRVHMLCVCVCVCMYIIYILREALSQRGLLYISQDKILKYFWLFHWLTAQCFTDYQKWMFLLTLFVFYPPWAEISQSYRPQDGVLARRSENYARAFVWWSNFLGSVGARGFPSFSRSSRSIICNRMPLFPTTITATATEHMHTCKHTYEHIQVHTDTYIHAYIHIYLHPLSRPRVVKINLYYISSIIYIYIIIKIYIVSTSFFGYIS